jgi:hypothetical protein
MAGMSASDAESFFPEKYFHPKKPRPQTMRPTAAKAIGTPNLKALLCSGWTNSPSELRTSEMGMAAGGGGRTAGTVAGNGAVEEGGVSGDGEPVGKSMFAVGQLARLTPLPGSWGAGGAGIFGFSFKGEASVVGAAAALGTDGAGWASPELGVIGGGGFAAGAGGGVLARVGLGRAGAGAGEGAVAAGSAGAGAGSAASFGRSRKGAGAAAGGGVAEGSSGGRCTVEEGWAEDNEEGASLATTESTDGFFGADDFGASVVGGLLAGAAVSAAS